MITTSCGLILTDTKKILIVRNTGFNSWDLPKGGQEIGETPLQACVREVREETGLELEDVKEKFIDLGLFSYLKDKRLHLFMYIVNELPSTENMFCSTYFNEGEETEIPEVDMYKIVDFVEVRNYLRPRMIEVFNKLFVSDFTLDKLSQLRFVMGFMLRHNSPYFDLNMDKKGFVDLNVILERVRNFSVMFEDLTIEEILEVVKQDDRNRFTVVENKIKANYGHSFDIDDEKFPTTPPDILYHGTNDCSLPKIVQDGLQPMNRKYVSTTSNIEMAREYADRENRGYFKKKVWPVMLQIDAKKAHEMGVQFFKESDEVYSSEAIPWSCIRRIKF